MCFDVDSQPPIAPIAGAAVEHQRLELTAGDGTRFAAFAAFAATPTGAGIVILPDVRGLYHFYEELALRFAEAGVDAVAVDYFGRTAGVGQRGDDFEYMPHVAQTTWAGVQADVASAAAWLRAERDVSALFTIGFCMGGRLSFDTATIGDLSLAGVIGLYGIVSGPGRNEAPAPLDVAASMTCPVLGLFGGADTAIPADTIAAFDTALTGAGVEHTLHTYPGTPHSFFDRKFAEFATESADAWDRVLRFVATNTKR